MYIQTEVMIRKQINGVLTFYMGHTLSVATTPENFMIRWLEHCEKGVADRQNDEEMDKGWTEPFRELFGRSLKNTRTIFHTITVKCMVHSTYNEHHFWGNQFNVCNLKFNPIENMKHFDDKALQKQISSTIHMLWLHNMISRWYHTIVILWWPQGNKGHYCLYRFGQFQGFTQTAFVNL